MKICWIAIIAIMMISCEFKYSTETNTEKNLYYDTGELKSEFKFRNERYHGIQKSYFKNGVVAIKEEFKNGIRDGIYRTFFENGKIEIYGQYRKGMKVGEWKEFDQEGKKLNTIMWKNRQGEYTAYYDKWNVSRKGVLNAEEQQIGYWNSYDENGNLTDSLFYTNGKFDKMSYSFTGDDKCFSLYDKGQFIWFACLNMKGDTIYKMVNLGEVNLATSFHENGEIKLLGYFEDNSDDPVNSWKEFDENGNLVDSIVIDKGKVIERYQFDSNGKMIKEKKGLDLTFTLVNGMMVIDSD